MWTVGERRRVQLAGVAVEDVGRKALAPFERAVDEELDVLYTWAFLTGRDFPGDVPGDGLTGSW